MTEEFISHLFEPFTRSGSSVRIEGTGLGLSITKGLVDLMEGTIQVESQVHRGTTFKVELPCEYADDESEKCMESIEETNVFLQKDSEIFAGRCFLIAEDNAINAEILLELLAMYGAKSVIKTDGIQVVKAFCDADSGTYDAILMDIQMPKMNGYEATRAIRETKREDAAVIPIIAMTANAFAEDIQASKDAGMDAHIAKPIDIDVLRSTLKEVLKFG